MEGGKKIFTILSHGLTYFYYVKPVGKKLDHLKPKNLRKFLNVKNREKDHLELNSFVDWMFFGFLIIRRVGRKSDYFVNWGGGYE